jgi:low temperature requirement protein LtrA
MANIADTNHKQNLEAEESRVTSLELFFDLVFVFTLTQLTSRLAASLSWESLLHAFAFGGGVGLYLIGTIIFRRASGIAEGTSRYVAAGLAVLTGFLGANLYAALQFAGLILILIALVVAEAKELSRITG